MRGYRNHGNSLLTLHRWTAISRGAVLYGATGHGLLERTDKVRSRVSRLNYGWTKLSIFDKGRHDMRDKRWNNLIGQWQAINQMQWGIRKVRQFPIG